MARRKPDNLYLVRDLEDVDRVLAELGTLKRSLTRIQDGMNERIDKLKAEAEAECSPLLDRRSALENGLLAFAEFHKAEICDDRRSQELLYGEIGFRRSSEIKPKPRQTWKTILGRVKELNLLDALRVREDVDREALRRWPEHQLDLVGAQRVEKDSFWYELREAELAGACLAAEAKSIQAA